MVSVFCPECEILLRAAEDAIKRFGNYSIDLEIADLKDDSASLERLTLLAPEAEQSRDMAISRYRLHQQIHITDLG